MNTHGKFYQQINYDGKGRNVTIWEENLKLRLSMSHMDIKGP